MCVYVPSSPSPPKTPSFRWPLRLHWPSPFLSGPSRGQSSSSCKMSLCKLTMAGTAVAQTTKLSLSVSFGVPKHWPFYGIEISSLCTINLSHLALDISPARYPDWLKVPITFFMSNPSMGSGVLRFGRLLNIVLVLCTHNIRFNHFSKVIDPRFSCIL